MARRRRWEQRIRGCSPIVCFWRWGGETERKLSSRQPGKNAGASALRGEEHTGSGSGSGSDATSNKALMMESNLYSSRDMARIEADSEEEKEVEDDEPAEEDLY